MIMLPKILEVSGFLLNFAGLDKYENNQNN